MRLSISCRHAWRHWTLCFKSCRALSLWQSKAYVPQGLGLVASCCCRPCPPLEEAAAVKVACMAVHEITEVHLTVQEVTHGSRSKFFGSLSISLWARAWRGGCGTKGGHARACDCQGYQRYWILLDHSLNGPVAPPCRKALYALWTRGLALGGGQAFGGAGSAWNSFKFKLWHLPPSWRRDDSVVTMWHAPCQTPNGACLVSKACFGEDC